MVLMLLVQVIWLIGSSSAPASIGGSLIGCVGYDFFPSVF